MNLKKFLPLPEKNRDGEAGHSRRIKEFVDIVFYDIPYSSESSEAQKKIGTALEEKYRQLREDLTEGQAFDRILSEYGQLPRMAALAGYSEEQAKNWRSSGNAMDRKSARKELWKLFDTAVELGSSTAFFCGHARSRAYHHSLRQLMGTRADSAGFACLLF